jgi:hypothetical protein
MRKQKAESRKAKWQMATAKGKDAGWMDVWGMVSWALRVALDQRKQQVGNALRNQSWQLWPTVSVFGHEEVTPIPVAVQPEHFRPNMLLGSF